MYKTSKLLTVTESEESATDAAGSKPVDPAKNLLDVLDLEPIDENIFRGRNESRKGMGPRLFGGQVLSQSLTAASRTVNPDRVCHSLHAYFMRPGDVTHPVIYHVEAIRDGRSFTTRRIVAVQKGEAIFSMDASFQIQEQGLEHQIDMEAFPGPDDVEDDRVVAGRLPPDARMSGWVRRKRPFDMRSVFPLDRPRPDDDRNPVWIRFRESLPQDPSLHRALVAYASDMGLVSTSMLPHRDVVGRNHLQMASLDHSLWFHREFDVTGWLLFIKESPSADAARGFNRASFYTRDGSLIASTMQEGLLRVREADAAV